MLTLNSISFKPISFKQRNDEIRYPNLSAMQGDVFVKSESAKENKESEFLRFVEEYNLIDKLPQIIKPENMLGRGYIHAAYSIPGCDEYVLRVSRSCDLADMDYLNSDIKISSLEDENLKINIGQTVGEIVICDSKYHQARIEVLKRQFGSPVGNPPPNAIYIEDSDRLREGEEAYESLSRKQKYAESIRTLASLPVESYEALIENYKEAAKSGYALDHLNSNNLLVDIENQSINFIDMAKEKADPNYGNLLYALTNIEYFNTYISKYDSNPVSDDEINEAISSTLTIISKYVKAMKKQGVKFDFSHKSCEFLNFLLSLPVSIACRTGDEYKKEEFFIAMGV